MLKLRTILLYDYIYYIVLLIVIFLSLIRLIIPNHYETSITTSTGIVTKCIKKDNNLKIIIKKNKNILINYYNNSNSNIDVKLGDEIQVTGKFIPAKSNYYKKNNIHYIVTNAKIKKKSVSKNIYYRLKSSIEKKTIANPYLSVFIIGRKDYLKDEVKTSFQENGISHLFSISGMHITLLSTMILGILKKLKVQEEKRYLLTIIILMIYLSLIDISPSAIRGVLFFTLFSINKIFYFYIKPKNIFILVLSIVLLINPFYIHDLGFIYSFIISLSLILMSDTITGNYLLKLLKVSSISFIISLPITLYTSFQINLLSVVYNMFYVPFISLLIFPLSLVELILPINFLYDSLTNILEKTSLFINNITFSKLIFPKLNIIIYLIYFILIVLLLYLIKNHKRYNYLSLILILMIIIHYNYPYLKKISYVRMLDVGQGDSFLIHSNNDSVLIDTGGNIINTNSSFISSKTILLLKSLGIRKLKYLIITHGDADHMGEAINFITHFKIEAVIFNSGEYNKLEMQLIKKLKRKKIPYYKDVDNLEISNTILYFLNTYIYNNENDNSNVIYFNINNYSFLFTGDAGIQKENDILKKYNLPGVDFLKIGHHGSNTSSSKHFISTIKPNYCLISVGKNNRYDHPKDSVINILNDYCYIYRTDQDGSIEIKINKKGYKIKSYS